jgi:lipopolysaccharide transport system ATP-binding protein
MLPAIRVENLGKSYSVNHAEERLPYKTLRDTLTRLATAPARRWRAGGHGGVVEKFWALRDVNFDVQPGEVVGIIGRNGAGKSTLLKILSRITMPTTGRATIRGRVGSLLEVGTGFHPELTGRENIYMNGSILGMSRAEIRRKFDEIVDFSGVEKFIDTPVKRYSSGMQVRLAFAVAANLDPEILIIDEVLAVGDAEFQKKCLGKMHDVARNGRTILFVSHNLLAVRTLCTKAIHIYAGTIQQSGDTELVINKYVAGSAAPMDSRWTIARAGGATSIEIQSIEATLVDRQPNLRLQVNIALKSNRAHESAFLAIDFFDMAGSWLMQSIPTMTPFLHYSNEPRDIGVEVSLPPLIPGEYSVGVWIGSALHKTMHEVREAVRFSVTDTPTIGRTVPHSSARGFIVPQSSVIEMESYFANCDNDS